MKILSLIIAVIFVANIVLADSVLNMDTSSSKPSIYLFPTNDAGSMQANLASFFPDVQLANVQEMVASNELKCLLYVSGRPFEYDGNAKPVKVRLPPVCFISVFNCGTNYFGCLKMPAINLCRIALLDKEGHNVKKTAVGMMYGLPLSQEQIEAWRHHWNNPRERMLIGIIPNEIINDDVAVDICDFSLKDAFEIKEAGEYELHLQMRLIQVGKDSSGKLYYPITWLPEVVAEVQIRPEDIPQTNSASHSQTNDLSK